MSFYNSYKVTVEFSLEVSDNTDVSIKGAYEEVKKMIDQYYPRKVRKGEMINLNICAVESVPRK